MKKTISKLALLAVLIQPVTITTAMAQDDYEERFQHLENIVLQMQTELEKKQGDINRLTNELTKLKHPPQAEISPAENTVSQSAVRKIVEEITQEQAALSPLAKFSLGGYGEMHGNFTQGDDANGNSNDQFDLHRLVAYVGYEFNDWLKFTSEIEIEHSFVSGDGSSGGELELEQAYIDFLLHDKANIRVGRTLVPVGDMNINHEPTRFNGVERPNFYKYIIPTTWWSDGIGIFGNVTDSITYQASVVAGMDGSDFSSSGIRGGRLKERPSYNDPAFVVRADYFTPFAVFSEMDSNFRLGASYYHGGIDNGNKGLDPQKSGDLTIYEADFKLVLSDVDLIGAVAFEKIDGAENIGNDVAEEIFGYYAEVGYHFWPDAWKSGKLAKSDAVIFARYDNYDTQYNMIPGQQADGAKDRYDYTFGVSFYPVPNLVLKADYQIFESEGDNDIANALNLGVGWQY